MKRASIICFGILLTVCVDVAAEVTAERSERGVVVKIDGELFTEYLNQAGQAPAVWPVIGPTGGEMTRSFPFRQRREEWETTDHPHHQSVWLAHDEVGGANFWKANVQNGKGRDGPHIAHREFADIESAGSTARFVARNDWMDGERRICRDERVIVCGVRPNGDRWIDFTITIMASEGDVTFGDTKEGTFAVRVADTMRVTAGLGGRIVNSEGQTDNAAWGLPARWVSYTGPVDEEIVGIAVMSHPGSFRPVPRWHVRGYGLLTANPFGQQDFPRPDAARQGEVTVKQGDALTLRYRVVLHRGRAEEADIEAAFEEFAAD